MLNNIESKVKNKLEAYLENHEGRLIKKNTMNTNILVLQHGKINIYFDYYSTSMGRITDEFITRVRVPLKELNSFKFKLSQGKNVLDFFRHKSIKIGNDVFDEKYTVHCKEALDAKEFLTLSIIEQIQVFDQTRLEVTKEHALGINMRDDEMCLLITYPMAIVKIENMNHIVNLCKLCIDQLVRMKQTEDYSTNTQFINT